MIKKRVYIDNLNGRMNLILSVVNQLNIDDTTKWILLDIKGFGYKTNDMMSLEKKVEQSNCGLLMSLREIKQILHNMDQLYEIHFFGDVGKNDFNLFENINEVMRSSRYVFNFVDGCFWDITSSNKQFIDRLKTKFKMIQEVSVIDKKRK